MLLRTGSECVYKRDVPTLSAVRYSCGPAVIRLAVFHRPTLQMDIVFAFPAPLR